MDLFPFQIDASTEIADKFSEYAKDPLFFTRTRPVPFYQNLVSLTGSGKTLILADAVAQIRSHLGAEPIVLWLSKGKVVVWQTLTNLASGKYHDLVGGFVVKPLMECKQNDIANPTGGLILVATVGKFNQADQEKGGRRIYQLALDLGDAPLWDMLKHRQDAAGRRRPFIIVYDEGHNLSDQQTKLLLGLDPDALIAASATMRIPTELSRIMGRLRDEKEWRDNSFVTRVKSSVVVESGLVKQHILLGGYLTPMEIAVNEMIESMKKAETAAVHLGLPFKPKAIYVSHTNVVGDNATDNIHLPFKDRKARPIQIWRHLVENCGVDPETIAVYCNLKFDHKAPPPSSFNLFSGGDTDYDNFIAGDYQHIIFNLTLQEGWDDPACYFAYIDKDMGSRDQVTQIIGRVLRQPQAQHYPEEILNTAHFFIRTDEKSVFNEVLEDVRSKIIVDNEDQGISLTFYTGGKDATSKLSLPPKKLRLLPDVSIMADEAMEPVQQVIKGVQNYSRDADNTVGTGGRIQVLQTIGSSAEAHEEWVEMAHSNRVTARWIFVREVQKTYPKAIGICDIENPKFDALVEYHSPAAEHLREAARKMVREYIDHSRVVHNMAGATEVPSVLINPEDAVSFNNALHDKYSGLNKFEKPFALALDKTQRIWFRNPSRGCFEIPLLAGGGSKTFNPDFVVWLDKEIIAIDTKGDHLILEAAGRKLFHIDRMGGGPDLSIRLITEGSWNDHIERTGGEGYTVWSLRNGRPHPLHASDIQKAATLCLRQN